MRHLIVQPPEGGHEIEALLAARGYTQDAPDVAPSATMRIDLSRDLDRFSPPCRAAPAARSGAARNWASK